MKKWPGPQGTGSSGFPVAALNAPVLVRYQIVEIRKRINNYFDSMVQGLGGKVMLQYTGLAKKILDVLRPTQ